MALKRFIVVLLGIILLVTPILMNADDSASSAIIAADRDARADTNGFLWFGAGCLFHLLGVGAAYVIKPSPRASVLLGKSPEYVAAYTDEYRSFASEIQTKYAWMGCISSTTIYAVSYFLNLILISSSATN